MSDHSEFYLNGKSSVVYLEMLEMSHSAFTSTKYLVRNAAQGVTVTHEDATEHEYLHCPMRISRNNISDNLDHVLNIQLGDLGEIIPTELNAIRSADGFREYPRVIYRAYKSSNLAAPLYGPLVLELSSFLSDRNGSMFDAKAPSANVSKTGELYHISRFPMLAGLVN